MENRNPARYPKNVSKQYLTGMQMEIAISGTVLGKDKQQTL